VGQEPAEAQIASEDPTPEAHLIGKVDQALVRTALDDLPPIFREVLVLREIEGLAYREIAEVAGSPIGTVMSRLARGRKELRKALIRLMEKGEPNAV
jgi:RNA polymerase sigma-70 factor, ECF subfamily